MERSKRTIGSWAVLIGVLTCEKRIVFRFNKLIWASSQLVIGATEKGRIYLVDPVAQSITSQLDKHTGSVHSIDMNCLQTNLFASGGSNAELMIWDLNDLKQPMVPGGTSSASHHIDEEVQCVAWNRQKSHILGSTLGGKTLIWDLKSSNEPIFKISDSTYRMRANRLVWHPDITSQLCVASEEDQSAAIQLWDLRYGASPMKLLNGHTKSLICPTLLSLVLIVDVLGVFWICNGHPMIVTCSCPAAKIIKLSAGIRTI